jgi:hypothetical protein
MRLTTFGTSWATEPPRGIWDGGQTFGELSRRKSGRAPSRETRGGVAGSVSPERYSGNRDARGEDQMEDRVASSDVDVERRCDDCAERQAGHHGPKQHESLSAECRSTGGRTGFHAQ